MRFPSQDRRHRGHVLLLTLTTLGIIGLVLLTYVQLASNQNQLIMRSQVWNASMALTEAGIEEALNHCVYNDTNLPSNDWKLQNGRYWLSNGLGEGRYNVSISETWPYEIISEGAYPIPGTDAFISRRVRVTTTNMSVFFGGLVVRNGLELNGNNIIIDSYDSRDPNKSTNGRYDPLKAGDNGHIFCPDGVSDSAYTGNADVYGKAYTGPTATLRTGPTGGVGSHAWRAAGNNGVQPGWWIKDFNLSLPDVTAPFDWAPPAISGTANGVSYNYLLGSGNWMVRQLSGKTLVTGHATVLVTDRIDFRTGSLEIAPGASVRIYMAGTSTIIGTTINANSSATNLLYFGLPTNTSVEIKTGGGMFTGGIYAPGAALFINGGNQLSGAAVAASARLVGNCALHFDEALIMKGPARGLVITSWEEL